MSYEASKAARRARAIRVASAAALFFVASFRLASAQTTAVCWCTPVDNMTCFNLATTPPPPSGWGGQSCSSLPNPPLLLSPYLKPGDSLVASGTGTVRDASAAQALLTGIAPSTPSNIPTLCTSTGCIAYGLQLNGGPGFNATSSSLQLLFGFNPIGFAPQFQSAQTPQFQFQQMTETLSTPGSGQSAQPPSALGFVRTDAKLTTGPTEIGELDFKGNDSASVPNNWGQFRCDAGTTTGGSADGGLCHISTNSGGTLTDLIDFTAPNLPGQPQPAAAGGVSFPGAVSFAQPITVAPGALARTFRAPMAGGGEVGDFTPLDVTSTNLVKMNQSLCSTAWTSCSTTNLSVASSTFISPDGSADMVALTPTVNTAVGYATQGNIPVSSNNYVASIYWYNNWSSSNQIVWQLVLSYPGNYSVNCIYNPNTGGKSENTNTSCLVFAVGNNLYRMVMFGTKAQTSATNVQLYVYANGVNGMSGTSIAYCPQVEAAPPGMSSANPVATRCLLTGGRTLSRPPGGNPVYTLIAATSSPETLSASSGTDILTSAPSSLTLILPSPPISGQPKRIVCETLVTALTLSGGTVTNAPQNCGPGSTSGTLAFALRPVVSGSSTTWYRVQ